MVKIIKDPRTWSSQRKPPSVAQIGGASSWGWGGLWWCLLYHHTADKVLEHHHHCHRNHHHPHIITIVTSILSRRSGAGDYMCTASNGVGPLQHATITLSVLCKFVLKTLPPSWYPSSAVFSTKLHFAILDQKTSLVGARVRENTFLDQDRYNWHEALRNFEKWSFIKNCKQLSRFDNWHLAKKWHVTISKIISSQGCTTCGCLVAGLRENGKIMRK